MDIDNTDNDNQVITNAAARNSLASFGFKKIRGESRGDPLRFWVISGPSKQEQRGFVRQSFVPSPESDHKGC